jgi:hypothetical protein
VLDAANTRKLIEQLSGAEEVLEQATTGPRSISSAPPQ